MSRLKALLAAPILILPLTVTLAAAQTAGTVTTGAGASVTPGTSPGTASGTGFGTAGAGSAIGTGTPATSTLGGNADHAPATTVAPITGTGVPGDTTANGACENSVVGSSTVPGGSACQ
jgi:hypothetical protein